MRGTLWKIAALVLVTGSAIMLIAASMLHSWRSISLRRKHEVFHCGRDSFGRRPISATAAQFHVMTGTWADEIPNYAPDPRREEFYIIVAMQLGDPRGNEWIRKNAYDFYELLRSHDGTVNEDARAQILLQYILWYERDGPKA